MVNYYLDVIPHKVALCKHVTQLHYTEVRVKVVTNIFSVLHSGPKNSLQTGSRICQPMGWDP